MAPIMACCLTAPSHYQKQCWWIFAFIPVQFHKKNLQDMLMKNYHLKSNFERFWCICHWAVNTLRPRQNGRHFASDTFKRIFMNENARISINISLKFVPKGLINNIPALVQIMAWRRPGDKPLSEPMMVNLLTHICVTRPQWVQW